MKQIFFAAFLFLGLGATAQKRTTQTYPVLANLNLTDEGTDLPDANQLYKGQAVRLSFTVINPSLSDAIKAGSCGLQVQVGNKLKAEQKPALAKLALGDYFSWSISTDEAGLTTLRGKLVKDLPADFAGTMSLDLRCAETGPSLIKAQWTDAAQKAVGSLAAMDVTVKKSKPQH